MTITLSEVAMIVGLMADTNGVVNPKEAICLARNVYFEARGESLRGQIAVANVTLNRVAHKNYPDTVCGVVYEPHQFSWASKAHYAPKDREAYAAAMVIAVRTMTGEIGDVTGGAMHFYNGPRPAYARSLKTVAKIGNHTFLR